MPVPEAEFDRYFRSEFVTAKDRKNLPGRLDLDKLDPEFASVLTGVQHHINQMFARQSDRIHTANGSVELHLDYIAPPERPERNANAVAFNYNGFFFVGLTLDLVERMFGICSVLSRSSASGDLLALTLDTKEKRDLFLACLFMVQVQFVIDHELGHHVHGHTPTRRSSNFFSEFSEQERKAGIDSLKKQAREVEADGYAVHMMAMGLFTDEAGPGLVRTLAPHGIEDDRFLTLFLLLSIGSFMFLGLQHGFDPSKVREETHPFGLMRMNVVMVDFDGWAREHQPAILPYLTQDHFTRIMWTIAAAQPDSLAVQEWHRQGEFLRNGDGGYREDLYAARELLRQEMAERSWSVG
jgi:hypothetical protein